MIEQNAKLRPFIMWYIILLCDPSCSVVVAHVVFYMILINSLLYFVGLCVVVGVVIFVTSVLLFVKRLCRICYSE